MSRTLAGVVLPDSIERAALAVSRRVQFKGKRRIERLLGIDRPDIVPADLHWVESNEGIRISGASNQDMMLREIYVRGHYQDDVMAALQNLLSPGDTLWDVGANYGYMSLWVDRHFGGRVKTVAFEPSPIVLPNLRANLRENDASHIEIVEDACSDSSGTVEFFMAEHKSWNATLIPEFADQHGQTSRIEIQAVTIDELVTTRTPPDVLKIDVEGAELMVVEGGRRFLSESRPPMVIEYNRRAVDDIGRTGDEFLDVFRSLGYAPHLMKRPLVGRHDWATLAPVAQASELPDLCNPVMLPA